MLVTTGFGYYVKGGLPRMKYELPIGTHPDPVGYAVVEVADKAALDLIEVVPEEIQN